MSRKLDARVAEIVMGLSIEEVDKDWWVLNSADSSEAVNNYSSDHNAAFEVIDEIAH